MTIKSLIPACSLFCVLMAAGCTTMPTPDPRSTGAGDSLAHQYGEEILAYMMQVVLGQAGNPGIREKWKSRGLDQDLNLGHISGIMSDPVGNKAAIIVNDPNILGLSKVLYHYAPEMSQFTGSYVTSLYPSTELVALRLFLLKRVKDDRKISIQSLNNQKNLLTNPGLRPTRKELAAMNLIQEEALLLQAIFESEPWLFSSLTNPFLVEAFSKTGVLEKDPFTEKLIARASYRGISCTPMGNAPNRNSVVLSFLPSITKEFAPASSGFKPTAEYTGAIENLKNEILESCRRLAGQAVKKELESSPELSGPGWKKRLDKLLSERISFQTLNVRPLVIYPGNADKVIRETCPEADFAVIILGRNVYLSMHIDPEKDIYPKVNRLYLDITDVKYSQVSSEAEEIGRFLYSKIKPWLLPAFSKMK